MEEKLKALEGITFCEWQTIKIAIDDKFIEENKKNTFKCDESVINLVKTLTRNHD